MNPEELGQLLRVLGRLAALSPDDDATSEATEESQALPSSRETEKLLSQLFSCPEHLATDVRDKVEKVLSLIPRLVVTDLEIVIQKNTPKLCSVEDADGTAGTQPPGQQPAATSDSLSGHKRLREEDEQSGGVCSYPYFRFFLQNLPYKLETLSLQIHIVEAYECFPDDFLSIPPFFQKLSVGIENMTVDALSWKMSFQFMLSCFRHVPEICVRGALTTISNEIRLPTFQSHCRKLTMFQNAIELNHSPPIYVNEGTKFSRLEELHVGFRNAANIRGSGPFWQQFLRTAQESFCSANIYITQGHEMRLFQEFCLVATDPEISLTRLEILKVHVGLSDLADPGEQTIDTSNAYIEEEQHRSELVAGLEALCGQKGILASLKKLHIPCDLYSIEQTLSCISKFKNLLDLGITRGKDDYETYSRKLGLGSANAALSIPRSHPTQTHLDVERIGIVQAQFQKKRILEQLQAFLDKATSRSIDSLQLQKLSLSGFPLPAPLFKILFRPDCTLKSLSLHNGLEWFSGSGHSIVGFADTTIESWESLREYQRIFTEHTTEQFSRVNWFVTFRYLFPCMSFGQSSGDDNGSSPPLSPYLEELSLVGRLHADVASALIRICPNLQSLHVNCIHYLKAEEIKTTRGDLESLKKLLHAKLLISAPEDHKDIWQAKKVLSSTKSKVLLQNRIQFLEESKLFDKKTVVPGGLWSRAIHRCQSKFDNDSDIMFFFLKRKLVEEIL